LPGDILLCRSEPFILANWAIGGTWYKHAAIFLGKQAGWQDEKTHFITPYAKCNEQQIQTIQIHTKTVAEAIGQGVVLRDFGITLFHSDWVVAVRPWTTVQQQKQIVDMALSKVNLPYNYSFSLTAPDTYYCTELAAMCICAAGIEAPQLEPIPKNIFGLFVPIKCLKTTAWLADSFVKKYRHVVHTADIKGVPKKLLRSCKDDQVC
jgi:hypothetical protein